MSRTVRIAALLIAALALVGISAAPAQAGLINDAQEIQIGREAAAEIEGEFGVLESPALTRYVNSIGLRIAARSPRRELPWTFKILNTSDVNAISLPGGFIYVTRGMLTFVKSDDELAFVLAHEVGHVDKRHHVQLIERNFYFSIVISVLFGRDPTASQIAGFTRLLISRGFSRDAEFQADRVGVGYAHHAGFNAAAGLVFMERLRAAQGRDPSQFEVFLNTHPALADRIIRVREYLRGLGYRVFLAVFAA